MKYFCAIAFCAGLLLLLPSSVFSQNPRPTPQPPPMPDPQTPGMEKPEHPTDFGSPESEMRAKMAIKAEKKKYDENLARAAEASEVASQISTSFETNKALGPADLKKLERLEKLARRIRNEAGGSEADPDVKDLPATVDAGVKLLAEWAKDLHKEVEKTPRRVVSAAVIDQANKLVGLIQYLHN